MALFKKDQPGSAPGYIWHEAGEVVEVIDETVAADLRKMAHAGFHEVFGHQVTEAAPAPAAEAAPAPAAEEAPAEEPVPAPAKAARSQKA